MNCRIYDTLNLLDASQIFMSLRNRVSGSLSTWGKLPTPHHTGIITRSSSAVNLSVTAIVTFRNPPLASRSVGLQVNVCLSYKLYIEIFTSMKNQSMSDIEINRRRLCTETNGFYCGKNKIKVKFVP